MPKASLAALGVSSMSRAAKTVSVIGFIAVMLAASRGLYLIVIQERGNYGLSLAVATAILACIAGGLMFRLFRHDGESSVTPIPVPPTSQTLPVDLSHKVTPPQPFDPIAWKRRNPWLTAGQADDRIPMSALAGEANGSLSGHPSATRLAQQVMYKKWSQARHDY